MSLLEVLLQIGLDEDSPYIKVFPSYYTDQKVISELKTITENFKNCGKGRLQHKNKIFYYRTYTPTIQTENDNDTSEYDESLYYRSNQIISKKKYFLIYLCDLKYKPNDIDNLTNEIFEILDNDVNDDGDNDIKKESCELIDELIQKYQNLIPNLGKYNQLADMSAAPDINISGNDNSIGSKRNKKTVSKKRVEPRMTKYKKRKGKSRVASEGGFDDLNSIKENETDLSIMFKQNMDDNMYLPQVNRWRNIKIVNIVMCISVLGIVLFLLIIFFKYF